MFVAAVMHRFAAGEGDGGGPERVVRGRNQYLVAGIQQCLHGHHNQLADAIAQINVINIDFGNAPLLAVVHHGLSGRKQAFGFHVALSLVHVVNDVLLDFFRNVELEGCRVADVQLQNPVPFFFEPAGFTQNHATNFITDIVEFGGFEIVLHGSLGPSLRF